MTTRAVIIRVGEPMTKFLGSPTMSPKALETMRSRGGVWFAYQNVALDSANLAHLQFLCCGPGCTFTEPPARMPDTVQSINWRYVLAGCVDPTTGEIVDAL